MATDSKNKNPKVVALDYYDGETEGWARSIDGVGACYFKMIAWDGDQDQRLFVIRKINVSLYDRILLLLCRSQKPPSTPVWLPSWKFCSEDDQQEADKIVSSMMENLDSLSLLALGESILDNSLKIFSVSPRLKRKLTATLHQGEVAELSGWLQLLN